MLTIAGEIDMSNARTVRDLLLSTLAASEHLRVDMAAVGSMDSSGIAALIETFNKARASGKDFGITHVSDRVHLALKLLCIEQMILHD